MVETIEKVCSKCGKVEAHYARSPSRCIKCRKADKLTANLTQEEQATRNEYQRQRYHENKDKVGGWTDSMLRRKYGITLEQYNELLARQGGVCAICGGEDQKRLAVDHDHKTGKVRGLLCARCNPAIGFLLDKVETAHKLILYLEGGE